MADMRGQYHFFLPHLIKDNILLLRASTGICDIKIEKNVSTKVQNVRLTGKMGFMLYFTVVVLCAVCMVE